MRYLIRVMVLVVLVSAWTGIVAAQELSKDEWQAQVTELTTKVTDLKAKLEGLQKEVADLAKQEAEKAQALQACNDEIAAIPGIDVNGFLSQLDAIDGKLNDLTGLSNADLLARRAELDTVQKWINGAGKNPLCAIQKYQDRINDQQNRLDALKKSIAGSDASAVYTVGTWARDRDCLWNIAKKPKIYDNPFLWPKIWQGNRDQIKNPDVIEPGQKLKIPPKASLTNEENRALRSYWSKKREKAAGVNP